LDLSGGPEVDVSCFGLDAEGKLSDERYFVFYNQPQSPCGAISAKGPSAGAKQLFQIDLAKLPATIKRLVFSATVEGASAMRQITHGAVRLSAAGVDLAEFKLQGSDYADEKALMLAEIYWKDSWRFAATGQGFAAGLAGLLKHFGGVVAEETAAPPTAAPPPPTPPPQPPQLPPPPGPPPPGPPPPRVSLTKLTLDKPGERKSISLEKGSSGSPIHINLNWDRSVKKSFFGGGSEADLDLGCMYLLRDGRKGVVQALGNSFGSRDREPFILLDKDDRSGASNDGENLYIYRPDLIEKVLVFAFIYEGTANFSTVNARLILHEKDGSETLIRLDAPGPGATFCGICLITRTGAGVDVVKEERYFRGHPDADRQYGFGFNWSKGSK
jgi:tellurite resistance protein TerA